MPTFRDRFNLPLTDKQVENLEYYFFKSQVTPDGNYKPLIFYQDYYCLGITLMTMYNYCGINNPQL